MKPTFLGRPVEGSVHRNTAYKPRLQPCHFRAELIVLYRANYVWLLLVFYSCRLLMKYLFPSDANALLT